MSNASDHTDGGTDGHSSGDAVPGYQVASREDEVSLLDILLVLARNKTLIIRTVLAFSILGITYSLVASEQYTSSAKVVRESQGEGGSIPGGLGGLAGGLAGGAVSGILGGGSSGLSPAAFPEVLRSREVRLAVVRDTFRFPGADSSMTFVEYVNRPAGPWAVILDYSLWLPWTLKDAVGKVISSPPTAAGSSDEPNPSNLSEREDRALKAISDRVTASVDQETGLMTIAVTSGGPRLAADLAESFLHHLSTRVRQVRTKKVREQLRFVKERFQEVQSELASAEDRLAQFLERNQNPTTASLRFQRDRLQRKVSFKEQLYSELQSQLTQTRLDLQRRQPVVTVVEEPVAPMNRSAPQRTFIIILTMIVGGMCGILVAFMRTYFRSARDTANEKEKLEELQSSLRPLRWVRKRAR